jgi:hypothetical protein
MHIGPGPLITARDFHYPCLVSPRSYRHPRLPRVCHLSSAAASVWGWGRLLSMFVSDSILDFVMSVLTARCLPARGGIVFARVLQL